MSGSHREHLNDTCSLLAMPATPGHSGWGGDTDDAYAAYATGLPCRLEVLAAKLNSPEDVLRYVVLIFTETTPDPGPDHRVATASGRVLRVVMANRWDDLGGAFHNYELECADDLDDEDV